MPISLPVDDEANELLSRNALALLIAMLLDQQVPLERAFSAPRDLEQPARGAENDLRGRLVMTFSADGLARAALRAHGETAAAAADRKVFRAAL